MFTDNSLDAVVRQFSDRELPPVERWNPTSQRDIDIRIDASGRWYYLGSRIERARMVALFSTILRVDDGEYFLVTPSEKLRIQVDDKPFVAELLEVEGSGSAQLLHFTDNVGNRFTAGPEHPLWVQHTEHESRPYVMVRNQLAALLARPVYYQLAELIVEQGTEHGVYSGGQFFAL